MKKRRNNNRPIVLALHDAAAIHRWLELVFTGRKFDNPIIAAESEIAAKEAALRLGNKLLAVFSGQTAARSTL